MVDMIAEAARIMLLEEALLGAPLRAADEADRASRHVRKHDRRDRGIIVGEVALGRFGFGKDHAAAIADHNVGSGSGRRLADFGRHDERNSVVWGLSGSVRLVLGGRLSLKQKKK